MKNSKFWMVYVESGDTPKVKHLTRQSAKEEAARLANKTGKVVYILEAIGGCQVQNVIHFALS